MRAAQPDTRAFLHHLHSTGHRPNLLARKAFGEWRSVTSAKISANRLRGGAGEGRNYYASIPQDAPEATKRSAPPMRAALISGPEGCATPSWGRIDASLYQVIWSRFPSRALPRCPRRRIRIRRRRRINPTAATKEADARSFCRAKPLKLVFRRFHRLPRRPAVKQPKISCCPSWPKGATLPPRKSTSTRQAHGQHFRSRGPVPGSVR